MTTYGSWTGTSPGMRLGYDAPVQSPSSVTSATTSVTVSVPLRLQTDWGVSDTSNTPATSSGWSGTPADVSVSLPTGGGTTGVLWTATRTVSLVYGSTQTITGTASLTGINAIPGTASVSWSVTVPARPYDAPAAPTGVSASRVSDTQHTVTWTRNATTAAPYTSQRVQRSTDGGSWTTIATVSGSATSYSDTTTSADHRYAWRVVAINSAGSATSAASAFVYTTPKAPGTPTAAKSGGNIVLTFTNTARYDTGIKVYESQDGGAFALLATVATANLTTYTHASPSPSVTHAYKVAAYNGSLESTHSSASNTVTLEAPPSAPTSLGPGGAHDATEALTLTWQHNPVDSSEQTKYQLRHRVSGASTWIEETAVASSTQSATITPSSAWSSTNGTGEEWDVRTWGSDADPSPYSATATLTLSARPTATIATPADAGTVDTSMLTVTWAYYDAEGTDQAAWTATLLDATAAAVETLSGSGAATSATFATVLPDISSWSVSVSVQDGDGLWSAADVVAFEVAYAVPPTPTLTAEWDPETGSVALAVSTADPVDPQVAAVSVDLYRSLDGGSFALIATGLPTNTSVTDWSPTVAGTTTYHAVAVSALPSTAQSTDVAVTTPQAGDRKSVWLSGGPGFSQVCRASSNVTITDTQGRAVKVLNRYAGRAYPVQSVGTGLKRTLSLSVDLITSSAADGTTSTPQQWRDLANLEGPHLWRDPDGRYVYVAISDVQTSRSPSGVVTGMTVTAEQIEAP